MNCAFYETEITPPLGASMPGYFVDRPTTGIKDKLYAKAFAVSNGEGMFAHLVLDCCEIPTHYVDAIRKRVCEWNDIPPECVAISCTHAHTGIACGSPLGESEDSEYMSLVVRIAADCVTYALKRLAPAKIYFGTGRVDGISFNRDYIRPDGTVRTFPPKDMTGVSPYSDNDPLLPLLFIEDENGTPTGAVICFACHQDCVGGLEYSGDYSSELSKCLKQKYGDDFISIYIAGASGDINHVDPYGKGNEKQTSDTQLPHYRMMGRKIAGEALRVIQNELSPVAGDSVYAAMEYVDIPYRKATPEMIENAKATLADPDAHGKNNARALLDFAAAPKTDCHKTPVQVLSIGNTTVFALPGELFHQFANEIRKALPDRNCLFSTLSNGFHGYIPVPELIDQPIYEAKLCFGSCLDKNAGSVIVQTAVKLVK